MRKRFNRIAQRINRKQLSFLAVFVVAGFVALALTQAVNSPVSIEPETDGCRDNVTVGADTSASAGQYLQFGSGEPSVRTVPGCYSLVWQDEFKGSVLDTSKWSIDVGPRRNAQVNADTVSVANDTLTIRTWTENGQHQTGFISTANKYMPKYGYMEARVNFEQGSPGMWSTFWIHSKSVNGLGDPWNNGVEMDVSEHRVADNRGTNIAAKTNAGIHWDGYQEFHKLLSPGIRAENMDKGYHIAAVEWTPEYQKYYIDGKFLWSLPNTPGSPASQRQQHFILSSEVEDNVFAGRIPTGGYGSRTTSNTAFKVDYVRVYQKNPTPPPAPVNVVAGSGRDRISLTWLATANASGYQIKRSTNPNGPFTTIATQGINYHNTYVDLTNNKIGYTDTSVSTGTTYYYQVVATSSQGESQPSSTVRVAYPGSNLVRGTDGRASASASPSQRSGQAFDGSAATEWHVGPDGTPWLYGDLGSSKDVGYVRIDWDDAYAKGYTVDVSQDGTNWVNKYTATNGNGDIDTVSFGSTNTRYVRVQMTQRGDPDRYGYGINELEVYPSVPPYPEAPGNVRAIPGNNTMKLAWGNSPGATSYTIKRAPETGGPYQVIASNINGTSYTDTSVKNDTNYYYVITAKNSQGESSHSTEVAKIPRANLALAKPALSSTETWSHEEYRAFDADPSTYWQSANSQFEWTSVDLQNTYTLNKVIFNWGDTYAKGYKLETSLDGASWTQIHSTTNGDGGTDEITLQNQTARYLRFRGEARSAAAGYTLRELEVYGTP